MTSARRSRPTLWLLLPFAAAACGDAAGPSGPLPASLEVVSGDSQQATVAQPLPEPIVVRVTDASGTLIPDIAVEFETVDGDVTPAAAATDQAGRASAVWTLGATAGQATLRVEAGTLQATILATALPGESAAVVPDGSQEQFAPPGGNVDGPPSVLVTDEFDNPVPEVAVSFQVIAGGGSIEHPEAVTDATGRAAAGAWTLGESWGLDTDTVTATVSGFDPVVFVASTVLQPEETTYTSFEGDTYQRFAWPGEQIAFLTESDELDPMIMTRLVITFDSVYDYYAAATGRAPADASTYEGRGTIAQVSNTCGAGCGYLGATGIELLDIAWDWLYDGVRERDEYDQVLFYEFGRNFWFYTGQLEYQPPDARGVITTGFALLMRFLAMDAVGVAGGPFHGSDLIPYEEWRAGFDGFVDDYAERTEYTWENTLAINKAPPHEMGFGATDLFGSMMMRLRRDYGGDDFIRALWHAVAERPDAETTQEAVDNFVIAASVAAGEDLSSRFRDEWRWPVSEAAARALVAMRPQAP